MLASDESWKQTGFLHLADQLARANHTSTNEIITSSWTSSEWGPANLFKASQALEKAHWQDAQIQTQANRLTKNDGGWGIHDTQTGMLLGIPRSARCVQRLDDSLNSAIHINYRVSLRSSSMGEPRDPLSKVVFLFLSKDKFTTTSINSVFVIIKGCQSVSFSKNAPTIHKCVEIMWRFGPQRMGKPYFSIMILLQVHLQ